MGLANRLVAAGQALPAALELAHELAALPQTCLRSDRLSSYEQWPLSYELAMQNEFRRGMGVLNSGESLQGGRRCGDKNPRVHLRSSVVS
jgi:enoyl-CoA hydratase